MAKQSNQKLRLLYINRILHELTDEFHGITLAQLSLELARYGICAERKTLYDDIECLRVFGVDVRVKRDSRVRYYLAEHELSPGNIRLLCDLTEKSSALSKKEKRDLEKRLLAFGGKYAHLQGYIFDNDADNVFEIDAMQNAELLYRAMQANKKISCRFFDWNIQKQRIIAGGGKTFTFSPWYADFSESLMFVVYDEETGFETIRADRMLDVKVLEDSRCGDNEFAEAVESGEIARLLDKELPQMMRFRTYSDMMNDVVDHFGLGITVISRGEDMIEFSAKAAADRTLFSWLFEQRGRVELISPDSARKAYYDLLELAIKSFK